MDENKQVYDYGDAQAQAPEGMFKELRSKILALDKADQEVIEATEALKRKQFAAAQLREREIPALMQRMGMSEWKNSQDGIECEVVTKIHASLPSMRDNAEKRIAALNWFVDHGQDKLIKQEFVVEFGRDDEAWAKKFERDLKARKKPLTFHRDATIHPQTLQKWVRDRLAEGKEVPMEMLGVHEQKLAHIRLKK